MMLAMLPLICVEDRLLPAQEQEHNAPIHEKQPWGHGAMGLCEGRGDHSQCGYRVVRLPCNGAGVAAPVMRVVSSAYVHQNQVHTGHAAEHALTALSVQ